MHSLKGKTDQIIYLIQAAVNKTDEIKKKIESLNVLCFSYKQKVVCKMFSSYSFITI